MKYIDEFNLINLVNKLFEFNLITEKQRQKIINTNRKRMVNEKWTDVQFVKLKQIIQK